MNRSRSQRDQQKFALGVDVVNNPATGLPICRSTLTNPTNGCVPLNVIGINSLSKSMVDYYTGTAVQDVHQLEDIWATTLRGTPFDIFGYTQERREERKLIGDYEALLEELMAALCPEKHATAVALAAIPEKIRGFGHVKLRHLKAAKAEEAALLAQFRAPTPAVPIAAE
jgi:hypothetical protein